MDNKNDVKKEENKNMREAGILLTCGFQGVGKSYQNKIIIANYVKDKPARRVRGRKVLILDVNSEYGEIDGKKVETIAVSDVRSWCRSDIIEIRRIDMKSLHIDNKMAILEYTLQNAVNCMCVLEDINTIALNFSQAKNVVSALVNLRHKAVDVLISFQSLRAVEPRILANTRWTRLHYSVGDFNDIHGKLNEPELYKIAQNIINTRYYSGDKRFFLYINSSPPTVQGNFSKEEFMEAAKKLLMSNKKRIKEEMDLTGCNLEDAIKSQSNLLYQQFYGNSDKDK